MDYKYVSGAERQGLFPLFEKCPGLVVQDFNFDESLHIMRSVRIAGVRIPVTGPKPPNSDQAPSRCRDPQSISTTPSQTNSILSPLPNRTRSLLLVKPLWAPSPQRQPVTNSAARFPERSFPSWLVVESTSSSSVAASAVDTPQSPNSPSAVPAVLCRVPLTDRPKPPPGRTARAYSDPGPRPPHHNLQHAAWDQYPLRKQRRASLQPCRPVSSVPNVDQVWFRPIREPPRPFPIAPAASHLVRSYGTLTGTSYKTKAALVLLEGRKKDQVIRGYGQQPGQTCRVRR
jgi:hypothetical protein